MIESLVPLPTIPATPGPVVPSAGAPSGSFGETLGAFLDANDAVAPASGERQELAEDGKDLPAAVEDRPDADEDPLATWFPGFAPSPTAPILRTTAPEGMSSATVPPTSAALLARRTDSADGPAPPPAPPTGQGVPLPHPVAPALHTQSTLQPITQAVADAGAATHLPVATPEPTIDALVAQAAGRTTAARQDATKAPPTLAPDTPTGAAITISTTPQPAAHVFAGAIAAATAWRQRTGDQAADAPSVPFLTNAPTELRAAASVPATGDTQGAPLDLTRDTGLQSMIDRIETLRDDVQDGADARDTRIRLTPDALGSIDVAVRREGERVAVRFTAEHDATRALLADAQPRLTELAAARGVRIGETSIGTSTGMGVGTGAGSPDGNGGARQPHTPAPFARAPAPVAVARDAIPTDQRLA